MKPTRPSEWDEYARSSETGGEAARRFQSEVGHFSERIRELASRSASLRTDLAAIGVPESMLAEIDARDAELAFAEAELHDVIEAFRQTMASLATERAKSVAFFNDSPEASLVTDGGGAIQLANAAAATLLAVRHEAMHGKLVIAFVARQDTRAFRDWLKALDPSQGPQRLEVRLRPRGEAPFVATVSARRMVISVSRGPALHWTLVPLVRPSTAELRTRMQRAFEELRSTLSQVRASARELHEKAGDARAHSEKIEAVAKAADLPTKSLDEIESVLREVTGSLPKPDERFSS